MLHVCMFMEALGTLASEYSLKSVALMLVDAAAIYTHGSKERLVHPTVGVVSLA